MKTVLTNNNEASKVRISGTRELKHKVAPVNSRVDNVYVLCGKQHIVLTGEGHAIL